MQQLQRENRDLERRLVNMLMYISGGMKKKNKAEKEDEGHKEAEHEEHVENENKKIVSNDKGEKQGDDDKIENVGNGEHKEKEDREIEDVEKCTVMERKGY
ncbi:hypothetical protein L3X38_018510 [Prunus dulcis]|uniref:Uncharacterized protein n=1 Tax=Prunus dulcis TaxID=3755 RepID=A0AAD4WA52_PRUDU|nr:hypothetical protein L3X38_018510 [Prunus dulcis]